MFIFWKSISFMWLLLNVGASKLFVVRRRDQVDVIAGILEAAKRGGTKTQIMHSVNLNHQQIERYLTILMDKGLLKETKQRRGFSKPAIKD